MRYEKKQKKQKHHFSVGYIPGIMAGVFAVMLALAPSVSVQGAREALSVCAKLLIPSLFPFFVCANILIGSGLAEKAGKHMEGVTKKLFALSGSSAVAVLMGYISGYPAGAAVTCRLYEHGYISRNEAVRLLAFTNNAGPLFVIGVIGTGIYNNTMIGYILLVSCILASLLTGVFTRFFAKPDTCAVKAAAKQKQEDPMQEAIKTVLSLCGYVVFFSVILAFAQKFGLLSAFTKALCSLGMEQETARFLWMGLLELSTAASTAKGAAIPLVAVILAFGGVSVLLQTVGIIRKAGLPVGSYCIGKLFCGGFAGFFCKILLRLFPQAVMTNAPVIMTKKAAVSGVYAGLSVLFSAAAYFFFVICAAKTRKNL